MRAGCVEERKMRVDMMRTGWIGEDKMRVGKMGAERVEGGGRMKNDGTKPDGRMGDGWAGWG